MNLLSFRVLLPVMVIFVNIHVSAQKIDSMLNVYRDNFPQEKVHVHFDKSYYNPGETIWFKAYLMSGPFLSDISKSFHAELINEKGVVIQKKVAPVLNASAASDFTIPAGYTDQSLHFRAYTTWMLNFDTSFLYEKMIPVVTAASVAGQSTKNTTTMLQFFPEGGDLVTGIESVVAFKANDRFGMPVNVNGFIKSADGKKISDFTTSHNGMGSLKFSPVNAEMYTAVWKDSTGKENTTLLPVPKSAGLVLSASNSPGSVIFIVKRSDGSDALKQIFLVAHMDQQQVYRASINMSDKLVISGKIPVDQLPSGILQLTVFNSNWQPVAERIVFVNNNDFIFDAYTKTVTKNLNKRGNNIVEIEVPDTLISNLSISITDAAVNVPRQNEDNIYSRLLLTADIKGYVHDPGYYFSSFADSVSKQLNLVMLTHGWRRLNWDNVTHGKLPEIKYAAENYLSLKGNLLGVNPAQLTKDNQLNLILQFKDSSTQVLFVPVMEGGKFATDAMVFYDTAKVYYQLNNYKRNADNLILNVENTLWKGHYFVQPPKFREGLLFPPDNTIATNRDIFEKNISLESDRNKKAKMLQEVVVKGRVRTDVQKLDDRYASGLFKGGDGYNFDLTNDITAAGSMSIFNYLQGKVPGLMISNAMSGTPSLSWRGGSPELFLNEMRTDPQNLSSMSMSDIAYIKVLRPPFMGAIGGGAGGAIAVYTKRGGDVKSDNNFTGIRKVNVNGYSPVREFYAPNYAQNNPLHTLDDIRTTLYWNPFVFLDKERKKVTIHFYNNDISKKLRVIIEGVNELGKLTRVDSMIE
ncbi:MAG: hypothetical protein WKF97_00290 [Chitinophagaceae bacterium]